jgi:hypothetical protein
MQGYTGLYRYSAGPVRQVHYQLTGGGENEHMTLILADMEDDSINTIASAIEQMTGFIDVTCKRPPAPDFSSHTHQKK